MLDAIKNDVNFGKKMSGTLGFYFNICTIKLEDQGLLRVYQVIDWLQPQYSAASCNQLMNEKFYIAVEYCSMLAAANVYEF